MAHRAVIYIRTSSETQGERSSPTEQEKDCLNLARDKGKNADQTGQTVVRFVNIYESSDSCRSFSGYPVRLTILVLFHFD